MTGGIPIRLRRTINDVPIDRVQLGGVLWHLLDEKIGVMSENGVAWYPGISPTKNMMIMNPGQGIGGKAIDGSDSKIGIKFDAGSMRIVNLDNDAALATFNADGTVTFANPVVAGTYPGGSLQKSSHPGFLPSLFSSVSRTAVGFVGPNTYLWRKASSAGTLAVKYGYSPGAGDLTHFSAERFTLQADVGGTLANQGLRMWLFDMSLGSDMLLTNQNIDNANQNRLFLSIKGPAGGSNKIRIGRDGVYTTKTILSNGKWQRTFIDVPIHDIADDYVHGLGAPYAVDLLHETTAGTWFISEPTLQYTGEVATEAYQYRTVAERTAVADAFYWTPPTQMFDGGKKKSFNLPMDIPTIHDKALLSVTPVSSDRALVVTDKERSGFILGSSDVTDGAWKCKFIAAYHGPLTDIV